MVQDKNKCISGDGACCYKFASGYPSCLPQNCKCLTPPNGGDWCPPPPNFDYPPCEEHDSPPSTSFTPNPPYTSPPYIPYHDTPPANYTPPSPLPTTPTKGGGNNQDHTNIITFIFTNPMLVVMIGTLVVSFTLILVLVHYCTAGAGRYTYTSSFDGRNNRSELRRRRARRSLQTSGSFRSFFYSWPPSGFHARPRGLDKSLICLIPIYTYEGSEGTPVGSGTECAVCLGSFLHGDKLRLLPKCTHSFHVECIDEWLRSRTTCPLCRANVVNFNYANAAMAASASAQQSSNPTEPIPTSSNTAHHQSLSSSNSQAPQNLSESAHPHEPVAELKRSFSDGLLPTKNASVARTSAMSFDAASSTSFISMEITKGKEAIKCPDNLPIAKNNIFSSMKRSWSGSNIFSFKRKNTVAPTSTSHSHSHERPPI